MKLLENLLGKLADFQERKPFVVLLIVLLITIFFGYYALRIQTDSSFDTMYRDDSQSMQLQELMSSEYGSTDMIFVVVKIDENLDDLERIQDIRHPDVIKAMKDLSRSLESESNVYSAQSIHTLFERIYGRLPSTLEESKQMIADMPSEIKDKYFSVLINDDYSMANMMISVDVSKKIGSMEKIEKIVRDKIVQTPFPIGVKASISGLPILMNRIMSYLINDNLKTIGFAIIGVFLVLWFYFKSYKIALFSSIPLIITLLWLSGTMYLFGIPITVITASVGAMMVGMAVDYGIHLTHAYHENVERGKKDTTKSTVVSIGGALFASVITTIAGFLAMLLGSSPSSQNQGLILSLGIFYAFITTILAVPPLLNIQRKLIYSKLDEIVFKIRSRRKKAINSPIMKFLHKLAEMQVKNPMFVIILVVVITAVIIPGFGLVYLDTDDENWVPDNDDVVEAMEDLGRNFGGTDSLNLLFMLDKTDDTYFDSNSIRDLRDPKIVVPMHTLDNYMKELDWVDALDSPSLDIANYNDGRVPRDFESIKDLVSASPDIRGAYNDDYSIAKVTIRSEDISRDDYYELLDVIDSIKFPAEVSIVSQGGVPEDIEFEETMGQDTIKTSLIGFVLVILIAALFYRSILSGLLAFFPIIFAMVWTIGIMGYINLPFTVLTTGMLAILMGMGIDFSIHLIHSIKEGIKEYGSYVKAIPEAIIGTGQAISITTLTTVVGFIALSFATLVNTKRLGWTLALGIAATFFACILIVPSILALKYKFAEKKKLQNDIQ